jgi:flagellar biosynthesis protein FlhB
MDRNDKERLNVELRIKLIELKLQRDSELLKLLFGLFVGILTLALTSQSFSDGFKSVMGDIFSSIISSQPNIIGLILVLLMALAFVILVPLIFMEAFGKLLNSQTKVYNDSIKEIERLLDTYGDNPKRANLKSK